MAPAIAPPGGRVLPELLILEQAMAELKCQLKEQAKGSRLKRIGKYSMKCLICGQKWQKDCIEQYLPEHYLKCPNGCKEEPDEEIDD